jgi:hypothetical protein
MKKMILLKNKSLLSVVLHAAEMKSGIRSGRYELQAGMRITIQGK